MMEPSDSTGSLGQEAQNQRQFRDQNLDSSQVPFKARRRTEICYLTAFVVYHCGSFNRRPSWAGVFNGGSIISPSSNETEGFRLKQVVSSNPELQLSDYKLLPCNRMTIQNVFRRLYRHLKNSKEAIFVKAPQDYGSARDLSTVIKHACSTPLLLIADFGLTGS